jgi:hypothetical protein
MNGYECDTGKGDLIKAFEEILLQPRYAAFIESSFAISDNYEKGLVNDLGPFELWCSYIAEEIAGEKIENTTDFIADKDMPRVLRMALNSMLNGLYVRIK